MLEEMGFSGSNSVSLCINTPLTLLTRFSRQQNISLHNRFNIILKSIIQAITALKKLFRFGFCAWQHSKSLIFYGQELLA